MDGPFASPFGNPRLDGFIEPSLPAAVGWWPLAPGWWFLIVLIILSVAVLVYLWLRWRARRAYRRQAEITLVHFASLGGLDAAGRMAEILKLTALAGFPRNRVASLSGQEWLRFLDETATTTEFMTGSGQLFGDQHYSTGAIDPKRIDAAKAVAINWIRKHHADP